MIRRTYGLNVFEINKDIKGYTSQPLQQKCIFILSGDDEGRINSLINRVTNKNTSIKYIEVNKDNVELLKDDYDFIVKDMFLDKLDLYDIEGKKTIIVFLDVKFKYKCYEVNEQCKQYGMLCFDRFDELDYITYYICGMVKK